MPHSFYYIVDHWLSIFKISLCPMHVSIKLTRYEYLLVLWTFKCLIFNLLHPLVFSNIIKVILSVVYIILNNFYKILCFKSVNSATEHWPQWILALYKCIILYNIIMIFDLNASL